MLKKHTCSKVRLAASTKDGIKLRLVSSQFILSSSVQFLLPTHTSTNTHMNTHKEVIKRGTLSEMLMILWVRTLKLTLQQYLSILFGHGDVNSFSFVTISLDWVRHLELIKNATRAEYTGRVYTRPVSWSVFYQSSLWIKLITCSSYLTERDQESTEVTRGVTDDGVLQLLPVLWKEGVAF